MKHYFVLNRVNLIVFVDTIPVIIQKKEYKLYTNRISFYTMLLLLFACEKFSRG